MVWLLLASILVIITSSNAQDTNRSHRRAQTSDQEFKAEVKSDTAEGVSFLVHQECRIDDLYCLSLSNSILGDTSDIIIDTDNETYIEASIAKHLTDEIGLSYDPFVDKVAKFLAENPDSTSLNSIGNYGFAIEESSRYRVNAYAIGVVVYGISNIDSIMGNFDVEMRIHLYNITQAPFGTIKEAMDTVYRNSSRTSRESSGRKDFNFYRLHEEELDGRSNPCR